MSTGAWVTDVQIHCIPIVVRVLEKPPRAANLKWELNIEETHLKYFNPLLEKGARRMRIKEAAEFERRTTDLKVAIAYVNGELSGDPRNNSVPILVKKSSKAIQLTVSKHESRNNT